MTDKDEVEDKGVSLFAGLEDLGFSNINISEIYAEKVVEKPNQQKVVEVDIKEFIFDKSYKCIVCDREFKERTVKKGKLRYVGSDMDLKPSYDHIDPLIYDIVMCPHCGYAALLGTFNKLSTNQQTAVLKDIAPSFKRKDYPEFFTIDNAIERYKLALFTAVTVHAKSGEKAYLCMRLAWLYKMKNDEQNELLFAQSAVAGFKEAYTKERFPVLGIDELTMQYIIANFLRKTKNYEEAMKYTGLVIVSKNVNPRLKDRALELKELIRKEKAEEANK